jgi:hypothetical protein
MSDVTPERRDARSQEPPCWHGPECSGIGPDCGADPAYCWPRRDIHVEPHTCPEGRDARKVIEDAFQHWQEHSDWTCSECRAGAKAWLRAACAPALLPAPSSEPTHDPEVTP